LVTHKTIGYDANGNMISQLDKNISSIQYNFLNLPNQITQTGGNTGYVYRADGLKVKKIYGTKTTDYLDGFQYENNTLQFIPTAEGYYDFANARYTYNYTDHLGNVRVSYYKGNIGNALVLEENNYYPFGLKHDGYNTLTGNPSYNYKYNGKELQETGMYDYGARFYMPDIGRWGVVDPLAEKMTRHSTYNYAFDNPIMFIDPDGRAPIYNSETGQYVINGKKVSFEDALAYANAGGNSDGKNNNENSQIAGLDGSGDGGPVPKQKTKLKGLGPEPGGGSLQSVSLLEVPYMLLEGLVTEGLSRLGLDDENAYNTAQAATFLFTLKPSSVGGKVGKYENVATKIETTVLGHYPEYVKLAEGIGARRFQIPTNVWNKMSVAEQWAANTKFLDRMILRGDKIRLATPLNQVKPGSFFQKELNYLFSKGYKVSSIGRWLIK
jgi:RHS repeat-associated protein